MINFLQKIRHLLIQGSAIHLWQNPAASPSDLISVMDRFLDGEIKHPMEWDDFISWENKNPNFEIIRQRIGKYEDKLFSRAQKKMHEYYDIVLKERNLLAALVSVEKREKLSR
jgi:hypothetical protein